MFDKMRFNLSAGKIFKSWGGDPSNPTINEMIIASPALYISSIKKRSRIFANNYVCADAILIICAYATKILRSSGAPDEIGMDLKSKAISVIKSQYQISGAELERMQKNRFDFFGALLDAHEDDISPMIEEAGYIFSYDLHYNKYVEYTSTSPLILTGIDKQFMIEAETASYFKTTLKVVADYLELYFK